MKTKQQKQVIGFRLDHDTVEKLNKLTRGYPRVKSHLVSQAINLLFEREQHGNDNVSLVK